MAMQPEILAKGGDTVCGSCHSGKQTLLSEGNVFSHSSEEGNVFSD